MPRAAVTQPGPNLNKRHSALPSLVFGASTWLVCDALSFCVLKASLLAHQTTSTVSVTRRPGSAFQSAELRTSTTEQRKHQDSKSRTRFASHWAQPAVTRAPVASRHLRASHGKNGLRCCRYDLQPRVQRTAGGGAAVAPHGAPPPPPCSCTCGARPWSALD